MSKLQQELMAAQEDFVRLNADLKEEEKRHVRCMREKEDEVSKLDR